MSEATHQSSMYEDTRFREISMQFYYASLLDILAGVPLLDLEKSIVYYEAMENYAACAGILKALKECEYFTYRELQFRVKEIEDEFEGY